MIGRHYGSLIPSQRFQESGYGPGEARRRAEHAIMRIEGSLVLSRVLNDSKPFHRALDELGSILLQPA